MIAESNFIGRLTKDPETKTIGDVKLVTFSLAVNLSGKGKEKAAHFFNFEAWRQAGEYIAKFAKKGDAVFLSADMRNDKFEDKNGNERTVNKLIVRPFSFGFCPAGTPKDGISEADQSEISSAPKKVKANVPSDEDTPW